MGTKYQDLHHMPEDDRITRIGEYATAGNRVGVVLEKDEPEKVKRYTEKVTTRFPGVMLLEKHDGPVSLTVTLVFGPRQ